MALALVSLLLCCLCLLAMVLKCRRVRFLSRNVQSLTSQKRSLHTRVMPMGTTQSSLNEALRKINEIETEPPVDDETVYCCKRVYN